VGPIVDAPRLAVAAVADGAAAPLLAASVVVVVVKVVLGAVVEGAAAAPVVAAPGAVVAVVVAVAGVAAVDDSAGFPNENKPPVGAGAVCVGPAVAVVVCALAAAVLDGAVTRENRDPPAGAAAGVEDGVVEVVVPPRLGNSDFWGVTVDGAFMAGCEVAGVLEAGKRDFCESEAAEGKLKSDVCVAGVVPVEAAVVAAPNNGFEPVSPVVLDSAAAGLSAPAPPNRDPPLGAEGVVPNKGFDAPVCPKRPPVDCG
jgi:hypothetical protein